MKYRKRIVEIDAIQFTGENSRDIAIFAESKISSFFGSDNLTIHAISGVMLIFKNNWLIKRANGILEFCDDDEFNKIYERVD